MPTLVIIAAAAGLASALMAATIASGAGLAMPLVLLAPLPLLIVALGWHPLLGAIGGTLTVATLALFTRGSVALIFAVLVAVPAWAFAEIAWRTAGRAGTGVAAGMLVLAACIAGAVATLLGALSISFSFPEFEAQLMRQAEMTLRFMLQVPAGQPLPRAGNTEPDAIIRAYAAAVPAVTTAVLGLIYALNLYLAGRIVRQSGRLPVPWPDVPSLAVPRRLMMVTAILMLLGILPGYPGLAAELLATAGLVALSLLGFATVHAITRGWNGRSFLLASLWFATLVFGLPAVIMLFVGIIELSFGLRARMQRGGPPPSS
jgi:hypothetical protein